MTIDRNDPKLRKIRPDGQQEDYLVLSQEERAEGFVRPIRTKYRHLACDTTTTMGIALAETYARDPKFYGGTFCCNCGKHFNLGPPWDPAFLWMDGEPVGSLQEEADEYKREMAKKEIEKNLGAGI